MIKPKQELLEQVEDVRSYLERCFGPLKGINLIEPDGQKKYAIQLIETLVPDFIKKTNNTLTKRIKSDLHKKTYSVVLLNEFRSLFKKYYMNRFAVKKDLDYDFHYKLYLQRLYELVLVFEISSTQSNSDVVVVYK
jgi:hypothetical protein